MFEHNLSIRDDVIRTTNDKTINGKNARGYIMSDRPSKACKFPRLIM